MFDFLRNWTKSAAARQQETMTAYLDNALPPAERQRFEQQMAQDPDLQAEVAQQQQTRALLRQLPPRQVPRNFTLDPALYGRPARQPLVTYYPALRAATVLTAVLLFFVVGLNLFSGGSAMMAPADTAVSQLTSVTTSEETADGLAFESAPAAAPFSVEEPALEEAAGESIADSTAAEVEATAAAPLPAASTPAATPEAEAQTAPLPTATVSDLPRPIATEVVAERAATVEMTAPPPAQPDTDTAVTNITPPIEAVATLTQPQEAPTPTPTPSIDLLAVAAIGLLLLLVLLSILTLYARRQRL
ncbi:MAG: hypothetical protein KF770_00765 [Anaerolineae bacterium]|nr:hypothetical protein [Anaerolineae bacterium]